MARIYVSIGSNIEREPNIRAAVRALRDHFGSLTLSSVYENKPIGFEGENFYNLVAAFDTDESPEAVATILHDIERQLGRERGPSRFSSRTIDLDLLLYGDLQRHDTELRIPRPEITEYACVLRPLAELAPKACHPRSGETFAALWARFDKTAQPLTPVALELPV
ncbi:MAG TPA: 2-amino-4-hydroxy-6-hydroxymethyldihydropteridine diphosphokinase [Acidiferrobacterales bacterium]|nr:2-amino-4-hydroxy-6-hydroxymethyldihydropteridine diphosphokinase [Acidiferrobacterales bacterium]